MTTSGWRSFGRVSTALGVGAIAAIASYDHIRDLALTHGQSEFIANLMPLSVDGLIVCATFGMDSENKVWPRVGFWTGVAATVSANILAARSDWLSRIISAWAPVALLLVVEILTRRTIRKRPVVSAVVPPVVAEVVPQPEVKPEPLAPFATAAKVAPATAEKVLRVADKMPDASPSQIAARAGFSETTVRRVLATAPATDVPAPSEQPV